MDVFITTRWIRTTTRWTVAVADASTRDAKRKCEFDLPSRELVIRTSKHANIRVYRVSRSHAEIHVGRLNHGDLNDRTFSLQVNRKSIYSTS